MKNVLVIFSDKKFREIANKKEKSLRSVFDRVLHYKKEELPSDFFSEHYKILSFERGAGYWLWKPYILMRTLMHTDPEDKILYVDCGDKIDETSVIQSLEEALNGREMCFTQGRLPARNHTKRDCFIKMRCDSEKFWNAIQIEAGIIAFKNCPLSKRIIYDWYCFCENEQILGDSKNILGLPNFPEFVEHRHDQSILSNLVVLNGLETSDIMRDSIQCNVESP